MKTVKSPDYLSVIWKHLTSALCDEVFAATRETERQRKWTLFALVWFWLGLLQSRISSQTRALLEARQGNDLFPEVDATPEAFFQKVQNVRPAFFRNVFLAFTKALEGEWTKSKFQSDLPIDEKEFPEIVVVDGSRLEKVGRLLKVARNVTKAIIPGSLEAVYDLRRGILRDLWFDPDGHVGEMSMFNRIVTSFKSGVLLVADRYYPKPMVWNELHSRGAWMVARYNRSVKKKKIKTLRKLRTGKLNVDDWLVDMGNTHNGNVPVRLRWVHIWNEDFDIVLITNVLDPKRLSPAQLLALYRERWSVERMYLAMKDVLDLNHLYNCSPAAVAQQVYATAILYNALRSSQTKIADKAGLKPEEISVGKLFPTLIGNMIKLTYMEMGAERLFELMKQQHPDLKRPDIEMSHPSLHIEIDYYKVEKRSEKRRKRRFCKGRRKSTSYGKIPGAKRLVIALS